jgi:NAD(P)-dependent dehydrogenase (short-subunit alcohol dehydrogenase family)
MYIRKRPAYGEIGDGRIIYLNKRYTVLECSHRKYIRQLCNCLHNFVLKIMSKVWLITGCSTGFGRELAKEVLKAGDKVVVTARNTDDIKDIIADYPQASLPLKLDVTDPANIQSVVEQTVQQFGRIDVLVNNAGIGYFAALEESEENEVRRMFEINFFGLANVTRAVLPILRAQRSGHIVNVSSIGGIMAFPGVGFYNATKFAVDGYSESLSKEVAPLGIKVTVVAPGPFRTDWAGRSAKNSSVTIDDYATTAQANKNNIRGYSGNQPGDPVRAAKAIIKAVNAEKPPLRLLLGAAALKNGRIKVEQLSHDFDTWEETTLSADFPTA